MRKILLSLALFLGLSSQALAADNYAATAGSGLTFGAKDAAGVLYSRFIGCDNTTVSQCWSVDSSGRLLSYLGSGAVVDLGAIADAAATAGSTGSVNAKLRLMTTQLDNINTNVQAAIPPGTNLIGDVNLRQGGTALSTTNGAYFNQLQGNAVLSLTNPSFSRLTDGTNGSTVKAASTPAAASDTALVVDQRPGTQVASFPGTLALGATFVKGTTSAMTGTSSTQIIAAVASNRLYITRIKCNNSSGTATLVQIQDGSGGTVLDTLAAGATYGGEQGTGATPLFWTTSGNGLFAQNVTTAASVICTASGYSG